MNGFGKVKFNGQEVDKVRLNGEVVFESNFFTITKSDISSDAYWTNTSTNKWTSGDIGNSDKSIMRITFTSSAARTINVAYTVSSESGYDFLYLGNLNSSVSTSAFLNIYSGTVSSSVSYSIPSGTSYIEFMYGKDGSASSGTDNATITITY